MKKFELFAGCFGNGTSYSNKAIIENGDYKKLCHVSECGKITWYVRPDSIPGSALLRIEHDADVQRVKWKNWLDSMPEPRQYEILLDKVPTNIMLYAMNIGGGLTAKLNYLKQVCYENSYC